MRLILSIYQVYFCLQIFVLSCSNQEIPGPSVPSFNLLEAKIFFDTSPIDLAGVNFFEPMGLTRVFLQDHGGFHHKELGVPQTSTAVYALADGQIRGLGKSGEEFWTGNLAVDEQSIVFNTDGLFYAEFFDYIFRGHFENIEIKREDMEFLMIFGQYLRTFGKECPSYLPANKVELMVLVCATEQVTTNGFGIETSRDCIEWKSVGSGLYARPDLYDAKQNIQITDALRTTIAMITDPNAIGNSVDLMHKLTGMRNDMALIFKLNTCNSAGIKRFEENLILFALNNPAIRMEGISKYAAIKKSGGPSGSQDFKKLINDLVANQAKTWTINRYEYGSISDAIVQSTDTNGRPAELKANYRYQGFSGTRNGWVRITFTNGLPNCIYFFDFPNNCKNPSSSIVASYAQGDYGK